MAKGGGAWKVAYADFVTAMMAFFLVMWICGQDQKIRRSVSYYFMDPLGATKVGLSNKPMRAGSVNEFSTTGSIPQSESTALGRGRNPYLEHGSASAATKRVAEWMFTDGKDADYWREQADRLRAKVGAPRSSRGNDPDARAALRVATRELADQLRDEVIRNVPPEIEGIYRDLLQDTLKAVNWKELAADLLTE